MAESLPPVIHPPGQVEVVPAFERIESLDALRGFAILGILVMNIQLFGMINAAYANPTSYGDFTGLNRWIWISSHVFADLKFLTIFSLLFGAGVGLFARKLQAQGRPAAGLHYRRMFWLLIFGLGHAYLMWHGDILVSYALAGAVVFLFRNLRPGWLMFLGSAALLVPFFIFLVCGLSMPWWPAESITELERGWQPNAEDIAAELQAFQGSWTAQMAQRASFSLMFQTIVWLIWTGWRTCGLMLIGMALLKWSVFSPHKPARLFLTLIVAGFTFGLPLITYGVYRNFQEDWSARYSLFQGSQWNYWGSLGIAAAYIGFVMLAQKRRWFPRLRHVLGAVGRMAFTNYLLQTLICTTLFYGHGLGWFGRWERWQLLLVVLAVWLLQVLFTMAWLRRFPQGPLEWLWRALTYWKIRKPGQEPIRSSTLES